MHRSINRRDWLRKSSLLTGSAASSSSLWQSLQPLPLVLPTLGIKAAIASYQDKEFMSMSFNKTMSSKQYLYDVLKKIGYNYIPSSANFVMFPIRMEGKQFTDVILKHSAGVHFW